MLLNEEIAMQFTLKAIECGYIDKAVMQAGQTGQDAISARNNNTSKEIANFYNSILAELDTVEQKNSVQ